MASFFVPTRFTWQFGGQVVHLCGSFTRWVETVPMTPVDSRPTVFQVVVHLPPGYHQYKFIVDGEWRHDETQPFMPDPLGNVNNWLFVRRPEAQPQNPGVSVISGGQLPQQAQQQSRSQVLPQHSQQQAHPQTRAGLAHPSQGPQGPPPPTLPARGQPPQQALGQAQRPLPPPPSQLQRQSSSAQHGGVAQGQQQQQHRGSLEQSLSQPSPSHSDVDMQGVEVSAMSDDSMSAPSSLPSGMHPDEPQFTRSKIKEFLLTHTAYELIPESGKVVLLDLELPVRQAFHALHEQNVPSAPLWDAASATVAGMISASDFIHILVQLRNSVSSGASAMSEAEMDQHTLRGLRQVAEADGRPFKQLVAVQPQEDLHAFVERLCVSEVSMAPVLTTENTGQGEVCTMLHIATVSGVLGCLMRHFRASLSSLPLLSVAVGSLPVGTWAEDSRYAHEQVQPGHQPEGEERRDRRRVRRLHTVTLRTPLTTALRLLLESGCSSLPVLDETGALVNVYARSDITTLCKGNSYNRLQYEDVVVGQALQLIEATHLQPGQGSPSDHQSGPPRLHWCTARDSLRAVLERLCSSSVRRLYVVEPKTRHVEGIISLSDLAAYLC